MSGNPKSEAAFWQRQRELIQGVEPEPTMAARIRAVAALAEAPRPDYRRIALDLWALRVMATKTADQEDARLVDEINAMEKAMGPRENPLHPMFRDHNCAYCSSGEKPCKQGNPSRCEYPHARND